jgi:chromosome segregation protein
MKFTRLRLTGFKSFVDTTDLLIEPGLTGIVGPNGCGKSNLVEALRWVMGETSARRMRGGEMEDVIFGGTSTRPSRNIAEVVLSLHNSNRTAPPAFNHHEHLEITRRIERGTGSDYRINGKSVRARDVQILFADHASGANSPALVSQGRVSAVISAKPAQRRDILEEAAGIGGLHARRHEAELRLKAAEANLERAEDILKTMNTQLDGLQKQAKQAARYRALNDTIRAAEALVLHVRWQAVMADQARTRLAFNAAESAVREFLTVVTHEQTHALRDQETLPPLRKAEAEAAQIVQRLHMTRERLDSEERQARDAAQQAQNRQTQLAQDLARANQIDADADAAQQKLVDEKNCIRQSQQGETDRETAAAQILAAAQAEIIQREQAVTQMTEQTARADAESKAAIQRRDERRQRLQQSRHQAQKIDQQQAELTAQAAQLPNGTAAEDQAQQADHALANAQQLLQSIDQQLINGQTALDTTRRQREDHNLALRRLTSDLESLEKTLKAGDIAPQHKPVMDNLHVSTGYEVALASALAEGLDAGLEPTAASHWSNLGAEPLASAPLPTGTTALANHVQAAPALHRALSQIGVIATFDNITDLISQLKPGQSLVSRDGDVWRWDGLVSNAAVSGRAAQRLEQKNRLILFRQQQPALRDQAAQSEQDFQHQQRQIDALRQQEQSARQTIRQTMQQADQARRLAVMALQARADLDGRLTALHQRQQEMQADLARQEQEVTESEAALLTLPDLAASRGALESERHLLNKNRQEAMAAQQNLERLQRESYGRRKRLDAIEQEIKDWHHRRQQAGQHSLDLKNRQQLLEQEIIALSQRPAQIEDERQDLLSQLHAAELGQRRAQEVLHIAEQQSRDSEKRLKQAEQGYADARETRARAETNVSLTRQATENLRLEIEEKLVITPDQTLAESGHPADKALPDLAEIEHRWQKLIRERENMGAVNLRAEEESENLLTQITTLIAERDDLTGAISRLRQGIGRLNKEAREKLLDSFAVVNRHFQELFIRLFGGGRAHLALTEAEDPLDAGLEIYASPPGKKLQLLSLLSGGEQALTAVALIFAVFLTNPAPICVLDEVDAPLDEANVDRFCSMLEEMALNSGTRFLVISHHRLTMARMHRLFGVTMSERGISQLVSVDLASGEKIHAAG